MPSDGPAILQPRRADFTRRHVEFAGDLVDEKLGAEVALFDPEVEKLASAGRRVGRNLFNLEVFRFDFDATADAGLIGGEERRLKGVGRKHGYNIFWLPRPRYSGGEGWGEGGSVPGRCF